MYENRLMYSSIQAANPYFFAKILFTIDNAFRYIGDHAPLQLTDHLSMTEFYS
jgi:hypothetical protein